MKRQEDGLNIQQEHKMTGGMTGETKKGKSLKKPLRLSFNLLPNIFSVSACICSTCSKRAFFQQGGMERLPTEA